MKRRQVVVGAGGLAATGATAGCLGFLTGSSSLSFEADPATASESAANETGYETEGPKARTITREFTVAGQTRTVKVTNQVTTYEKTVEFPLFGQAKLGVFAAVATPKVKIAGRTFNPIANYSNQRLVRMLSSNYESIKSPSKVNERTVETLGTRMTLSKFAATATFQGQEVDVYIHVGKVPHGDDYVVALGIYPQQRESQEQPNILRLTRSLQHPANGG